jgi:hypothetical protein
MNPCSQEKNLDYASGLVDYSSMRNSFVENKNSRATSHATSV